MESGWWDADLLASVQAMIPQIEGKPCVNISVFDRAVFRCRGIRDIAIDETSVNGMCDWVDPEEVRPDELTDGLAISCDCLQIGPGWWLDTYFNWYFVFDSELVARSFAGDNSWVYAFLAPAEGLQAAGFEHDPVSP